jgi:site-specific DNA-cytosine methylase
MTFSAHLTDASAELRQQNLSLLTQGDAAVLLDSVGGTEDEDDLLPVGLDSHRYRCCGNGVVAPVAEWIGRRIVEVDRRWREEEAK